MITKVLYTMDTFNKRIITGVVENATEDFNKPGPVGMAEGDGYRQGKDEAKITNSGEQYYCELIAEDGSKQYLGVMFKKEGLEFVVGDLVYAFEFSKDVISSVLDNFEYFGAENIKEYRAGFYQNKRGVVNDKLEKTFRKVRDDSYVQFRSPNCYLGIVDGQLDFVDDFSEATKVRSRELRKRLLIEQIATVDQLANLDLIAISPYNCFSNKKEVIYAGHPSIKVSYEEGFLNITIGGPETEITDEFRMVNNQKFSSQLEKISNLLKKEESTNKSYVEHNHKYLSKTELGYTLVDNPSKATLIDDKELEIVKTAFELYYEEFLVSKFFGDINFLYEIEESIFQITNQTVNDSLSGSIITKWQLEEFYNIFTPGCLETQNTGCLVINENRYLQMKIVDKDTFIMIWHNSGFEATIFTDDQARLLTKIFNFDIRRKEIKNTLNPVSFKTMNVNYTKQEIDLNKEYTTILNSIKSNKYRMTSYTDLANVKVETEKGALEYLRHFYIKDVLDTENVLSRLFKEQQEEESFPIHNILIIGSGCNLDLIGLNMAYTDKLGKIKVSTANTTRWGYLPSVKLNNNIEYVADYRLKFADLPSSLLAQYDLIIFSKGVKDTLKESIGMYRSLEKLGNKMYLVNINHCKELMVPDSFHAYFKKLHIKRKYIKNNYTPYLSSKIAHENLNDYLKKVSLEDMKNTKEICFNDEASYHSIIKKTLSSINDFYGIK